MSGIYLHIPFCRRACHYCDFHFSTSFKTYQGVIHSTIKELNHWSSTWHAPIQTIYFGGGTPSTLKSEDLGQILDLIRSKYQVEPAAEITLEANPEDINVKILREWKSMGINRLSMGVQSFFEDELSWMNRNHSAEKSKTSVKMAQDAGFENITIDLMYGLPVSNSKRWSENVQNALDLNVPHLSAYALTVEERTALYHQIKSGDMREPSEEEAHEQFLFLRGALQDAGYEHYEISNFAMPGWRSVHNGNYWNGVPYLGIGPGAHGYDGDIRRMNISNNAQYIRLMDKGDFWYETEELSTQDRFNELAMTHLRKAEGISLEEVQVRFGDEYKSHLMNAANSALEKGWLEWKGDRLTLTESGILFADGITVELMRA